MHHKLSLRAAILINMNVMVGFGIFINTVVLAKLAGFYGFACYALVAALIFPLIVCIAALFRIHPEGGFYVYAKELHPVAGFLSAWVYFTGKLASAALIIHVIMTLLQSLIPMLNNVSTLTLDTIVLCIFAVLNTLHMRVASSVAGWFITLKLLPIIFAILSGLYLLKGASIPSTAYLWQGIPLSIPFVLYAFTGFEASCSLSKSIEFPERNGPKAIYISFILALCINILYQFLFFMVTNGDLMNQENYLGAYPTLLQYLIPHSPAIASKLIGIIHIAIAIAALGGSYGILFSNHWNLYMLAEHKHTFMPSLFTKLNKYHIPVAGIIAETILCCMYLYITQGNQAPLQQLSALGSTIAYTLSILGLLAAYYKGIQISTHWFMPWLALASCAIFIGACIRNFILFGATSLIAFTGILLFGVCMYLVTSTHLERHQRN